jgi:predicted  nucleic acid-binding Zn-ribbon protein
MDGFWSNDKIFQYNSLNELDLAIDEFTKKSKLDGLKTEISELETNLENKQKSLEDLKNQLETTTGGNATLEDRQF